MKKVNSDNRIPIKLWLEDMETGAMQQADNLANLPFAFKHIPVMPDSHQGYGMPIGAILATKGVVVPNGVGVDIGCGMCALQTDITEIEEADLKSVMSMIRESVPVGFNWHEKPSKVEAMPNNRDDDCCIVSENYEKAQLQLGTLGGGNHFIEIQKGSDGFIWIMIHSGSRNLGYKVAEFYNNRAKKLNERYHSLVSGSFDLAFLPVESDEFRDYMTEMEYCVGFALANRQAMMHKVQWALKEKVKGSVRFGELINKAHNYAAWENHFGENVIVHRKGACRAREGEIGMIPGSMGTSSFIVEGLGEKESFQSCSHGAGRRMGRKQAQRELNLDEQKALLDEQGVIHSVRDVKDLDEAPGAYKDINTVMANQTDLVEVLVELKPLAVIKG